VAIDVEAQLSRFKTLDSDRANWKWYWEDVARYCAPRRMGFMGKRTDGDRRVTPQIYNPIGINCVQTLAAALHGMVMNPATNWLRIRLTNDELDDTPEARAWTNGVSKRIATTLASPQTSFHTNANQLLEDLSSIGTGVMYCGQQKSGHLFVRTHTIGEVVIAENEYGFVDTVMRDSEYTVRQLIMIWRDNVSKKVRELYDKGKYDRKFKVVNVCTPRRDDQRDMDIKTPAHMPIAIAYIEEDTETLLEESGTEEMPYVVPRWWLATGEVYGRSPAMTALPQIKVSNVATKTVLDAAEKAVNPPLTVPHEGLIGPVRSSPGALTYLRNKTEIGQLPTSAQLPYAGEYIQALDNSIRTTMFVDQVQFVGDFKMTATEVIQRQTERMRLLGPVLGRLENEFLNPLIVRVFGIMNRMGLFDKPPQGIQGADMRIEYQSPLARAQKSQIAQGFQQALATMEPLAKLSPQIAEQLLGPIDFSKVTPTLFDWFGVDTDLLKGDQQMDQDARMAQARQMVAMAPPLAQAGRDAGAGIRSVMDAGQTGVETANMARQMMPTGPNGQPVLPGPPLPPPGAGGQNVADLIGSVARGLGQAAPAARGNINDLLAAFQGRPQ